MLKHAMFASGALLLAVAAIGAQDTAPAKKPLLNWKITGDTAEEFKAEFEFGGKIDQSTPEALVNTHNQLCDNRSEHQESGEALMKAVFKLIDKSMDGVEKALLSEELLKGMRAPEDDERSSRYKRHAAEITGQSDGPDGSKYVEVTQKMSYDDEVNENKQRFKCVKGDDGKWLIDGVEAWEMDWSDHDGEGEPPYKWQPTMTMVHWLTMEKSMPPIGPAPELKQDTPENAAMALFTSVLERRDAWDIELQGRALKVWVELLGSLYTDAARKAPDGVRNPKPEEPKREIDKVTDGEDGVKKVLLKKRDQRSEPVEIHVKKSGEVWQVIGAGYYVIEYDMEGEARPGEFVPVTNLKELAWR